MRYIDLLNAAISNAQKGLPPEQAGVVVDTLAIAETLFDEVSQAVSETIAGDESRRSLLRRTKSITLAAGSATLDTDVLTRYIADALTKKYAWRDYPDFVRRGDTRVGVFSIKEGRTLVVCDPSVAFAVPLTTTGARSLTTPCYVVKPATFTTAVDAPPEVISDLSEALSDTLRGTLAKLAGANV